MRINSFDQLVSEFSNSIIGIDRMFSDMNNFTPKVTGYPPYNIEKVSDNSYKLTFALAGFSKDEINIVKEKSNLVISSNLQKADEQESTFLYKGIAKRAFKQIFKLAEYIEIDSAEMKDGLLSISLVRFVPEAEQPKTIEIR